MYSNTEQLLLKACQNENHDGELAVIRERYSCDIHIDNLKIQIQTLWTNLDPHDDASLHNVVKYIQNLPKVARLLYSEVMTGLYPGGVRGGLDEPPFLAGYT